MTEFGTWTEEEKTAYFNIIGDRTHRMLSAEEVEGLSENVQYALIDFWRSVIVQDRPRSIWQKIKDVFTK